MKPFLLILFVACLSCGGMLPERTATRKPAGKTLEVRPEIHEKRVHLDVLEARYIHEDRSLELAIVRGMILKLQEKHPGLHLPASPADQRKLRNDPAFLSLQMTVEHLSHRESVKIASRQSASRRSH